MRYETTPAFVADIRRLSKTEAARFRRVVADVFSPASDAFMASPSTPFPASLRVKSVAGAAGIFELTWSFAGPDGRATFEWIEIEGEPAIRWRRVGGHRVLREPRRG